MNLRHLSCPYIRHLKAAAPSSLDVFMMWVRWYLEDLSVLFLVLRIIS